MTTNIQTIDFFQSFNVGCEPVVDGVPPEIGARELINVMIPGGFAIFNDNSSARYKSAAVCGSLANPINLSASNPVGVSMTIGTSNATATVTVTLYSDGEAAATSSKNLDGSESGPLVFDAWVGTINWAAVTGISVDVTYSAPTTEPVLLQPALAFVGTAGPTPLHVDVEAFDPSCSDVADGRATATASGGTEPYTYDWSTGATGDSINGLSAGEYSITVTDATQTTVTEFFTLTAPPPMELIVLEVINPSCFDCADGSATVEAAGGNGGPYSYVWRNDQGEIISEEATATGLASGLYDVVAYDSAGCTIETQISLCTPLEVQIVGAGCTPSGGRCLRAIVKNAGPLQGPFQSQWFVNGVPCGQNCAVNCAPRAGLNSVTVTDLATNCQGTACWYL